MKDLKIEESFWKFGLVYLSFAVFGTRDAYASPTIKTGVNFDFLKSKVDEQNDTIRESNRSK